MSDHENINIFNDNIDVKVVLQTEMVYSATLFTISNIVSIMESSTKLFFKSEDMIILKDLSKMTITQCVSAIVEDNMLDFYFSKVGELNHIFSTGTTFNQIIPFGTPSKGFTKRIY